jgi:hypothetical protein
MRYLVAFLRFLTTYSSSHPMNFTVVITVVIVLFVEFNQKKKERINTHRRIIGTIRSFCAVVPHDNKRTQGVTAGGGCAALHCTALLSL